MGDLPLMIETLHKCRKCIFPLFKYDKIFVKIYARTLFTKCLPDLFLWSEDNEFNEITEIHSLLRGW